MPTPETLATLRAIVGPRGVVEGAADEAPYLRDYRGLYQGRAALILRPGTVSEVSQILATCNAAGVAVVPHGGNTGYCGGSMADESGEQVLLSLARLNQVRSVDPLNYSMTVEAGCVLASLQQLADSHERYFPLSLGAEGSCQIGGNLSTNAGGTAVLRYGMARDLVLGLEVVLADGSVLDLLRSLRKDNTGYDLKSLFVGAEGTLGVITAATLKLFPKPASRATALLALESPRAAVQLLAMLRAASADRLTACELFARSALELVTRHIPGTADPFDSANACYLLVEVQSAQADEPLDTLLETALAEAFEAGLVQDAAVAANLAQRVAFWKLRETIPEALAAAGGQIKHDVSVPIARVPEFIDAAGEWVRAQVPGVVVVPFGHIGDGNIHFNLSQPPGADGAAFVAGSARIEHGVHDIAHRMGGSFSAEHGIGKYKLAELARYRGGTELEVMRALKRAFDPRGILNPGKLFAAP